MKAPFHYVITLFLTMLGAWLLLSGVYETFVIIMGVLSTIAVLYVVLRMDFVDDEGLAMLHLGFGIFGYLPWFFLEIIKSNLAATKIILNPSLPIDPKMFRVRGMQRTDLGRMVFANSITLTPGTITVAVTGDTFHVHALAADLAEGMDEGAMNVRVAALEKEMVD